MEYKLVVLLFIASFFNLYFLLFVLYYMQEEIMGMLRYKKRIIRNMDSIEEVYLNISRQTYPVSPLDLTALGCGTLFPGKTLLVHNSRSEQIYSFILHDCQCKVLSTFFPIKTIYPGEILLNNYEQEFRYQRENNSAAECYYRYLNIQKNVHIEALFGLNETKIFRNFNPEKVKSIIDELEQMVSHSEQYSVEDISVKIFEFLMHICFREKLPISFSGKYSNLIRKVSFYPQDYRNLAALQNTFALERSALTRLFLRQTGRTPMAFVIYSRLINSCWQLQYTNMSIGEIAITNGYRNPAFYSRAFKAQFGMSPAKYRQTMQQI